jgi:hypothetical protein
LVPQAFEATRRARDASLSATLLRVFFASVERVGLFSHLLKLPLSAEEDHALESYLLDHWTSLLHREHLFVFYLERHRLVEAVRLHTELGATANFSSGGDDSGASCLTALARTRARQVLVDNYLRVLPKGQVPMK